jgi:WD40 repeat protein
MLLTGHEGAVYSIAFDPSGQHLASGSYDRNICEFSSPHIATQPHTCPCIHHTFIHTHTHTRIIFFLYVIYGNVVAFSLFLNKSLCITLSHHDLMLSPIHVLDLSSSVGCVWRMSQLQCPQWPQKCCVGGSLDPGVPPLLLGRQDSGSLGCQQRHPDPQIWSTHWDREQLQCGQR